MSRLTFVSFRTGLSTDSTPAEYIEAFDQPIPVPTVAKHSFRLVCDLEPVRSLGGGLHADGGQFNWVNFTGGYFCGSIGQGEIMPGGQDAQHITPASHPSSPLSALLSTRYLLRTDDGTYIQAQTRGWRTGPKEVMQRLSDAAKEGFTGVCPAPQEYKFRLFIEFETDAASEKYGWLNTAMFVGSGVRLGRQVIYDAYQVE